MTNNGMGNALTLTLHSRFRPNHVLVEEDSFELVENHMTLVHHGRSNFPLVLQYQLAGC